MDLLDLGDVQGLRTLRADLSGCLFQKDIQRPFGEGDHAAFPGVEGGHALSVGIEGDLRHAPVPRLQDLLVEAVLPCDMKQCGFRRVADRLAAVCRLGVVAQRQGRHQEGPGMPRGLAGRIRGGKFRGLKQPSVVIQLRHRHPVLCQGSRLV